MIGVAIELELKRMKIGSRNRMPKWAQFLTVLIGIPLVAALVRAALEHQFGRSEGLILAFVVLLVLSLPLYLMLRSRPDSVPISADERKRETRKLDIAMALVLASIFVPGGGLLMAAGFSALKNDPSPVGRWVVGIFLVFVGLIGLLLGLGFILQSLSLLTGKSTLKIRNVTIRVGRSRK